MRFFSGLALLTVTYAAASTSPVEEAEDLELTARIEAALAIREKLTGCVDSDEEWTDVMGEDCAWYQAEPGARCELADILKSDDGDADDICCVCGGGTISNDTEAVTVKGEEVVETGFNLGCGGCENTPGWKDAALSDCSFYEENTSFRCSYAAVLSVDGVSASDACCVCGGGQKAGCSGEANIQSVGSNYYLAIQEHGASYPYINAFPVKNILTRLFIEDLGNDVYAIRSWYYAKVYMCVGQDGISISTCTSIGKSAKWMLTKGSNGYYSIKSVSTDKYLDFISVKNSARYPVSLTSDNYDEYTMFKITMLNADVTRQEDFGLVDEKRNLRSA